MIDTNSYTVSSGVFWAKQNDKSDYIERENQCAKYEPSGQDKNGREERVWDKRKGLIEFGRQPIVYMN